ncbi:Aste57867_23147 [Aphanomyces stellatus]|uniref:Mitochondrial inner membrane protease ATP23 n=1 Tax=Aphanomyces stellatus TaxID=120398 RepID=A0A485LMS1_9STRA|nr:hypothetical protein As57867_023076 [Aphanomyces stellatus]VFT99795.1 Aste57867_23147 [Aphanomyces stellatus]
MDIPRCEEALQQALKEPRQKQLVVTIDSFLKKTKKTADDPSALEFVCLDCKSEGVEGKARAFFASPPAIVLCANRLHTTDDVKEVVVHELIHAYDYTVRKMDLTQPDVLACSEVRSARESECYEKAQALCNNPQFGLVNKGCEWWVKKCVKQNAVLATSSLFPADAEKHVTRVFDTCYADKAPFHK